MLSIKKYAAIDIGSNAMRLLITNIIEEQGKPTQFNKSSLVRVPIRLGQDAFTTGKISEENIIRMIDAMYAYKLLMNIHKIEKYKACATSAMREATNGKEIITQIAEKTGITIDVIDGKTEAAIIASSDLKEYIQSNKTYLYVDVGGGSTEFSLYANGKLIQSKSFKIGTVRLLNNMVVNTIWIEIKEWIKTHTKPYTEVIVIGSGGNINKLFKLSQKKYGKPLSFTYIKQQFSLLNKMTYQQRVSQLKLNPDRADVIIHATKIYLNAMKWSNATKMYVPKIGLADGVVKAMYSKKI